MSEFFSHIQCDAIEELISPEFQSFHHYSDSDRIIRGHYFVDESEYANLFLPASIAVELPLIANPHEQEVDSTVFDVDGLDFSSCDDFFVVHPSVESVVFEPFDFSSADDFLLPI